MTYFMLRFQYVIIDTFYTDNNEWFIDSDDRIGIIKLVYDIESDIPASLTNYRFLMWQDDFRRSNITYVGEVHINSVAEMQDFFISRGGADGRAILLGTKMNKTDIFITDELEGVFLQGGFHFILSK